MMHTFTEVDFYKSINNLLYKAIEIKELTAPRDMGDGKIGYAVDDGGMKQVMDDIKSLEKALAILKQDNS